MFEPLSEEAQEVYFDLVRTAWKSGLISSSELHKRLRVLDDMRSRESSWTYNPTWIRRQIIEPEEYFETNSEERCFPVKSHQEPDEVEHSSGSSTRTLQLIVQLASAEWKFHKGDADPHPSVPHGHGRLDEKRKMDAYLGYTYIKTTPEGRLTKRETIKLWNDDSFRRFAREAIKHFIATNPSYNFRVKKPFRLPRKR